MDKRYKSRKLIAFIVNNAILVTLFMFMLFTAPSVLTTPVIVTAMSLIVLNGITYIGGKALETWAKSKWFQSELMGK